METEDKIVLLERQLLNKVIECKREADSYTGQNKESLAFKNYYMGKQDSYSATYSLIAMLFEGIENKMVLTLNQYMELKPGVRVRLSNVGVATTLTEFRGQEGVLVADSVTMMGGWWVQLDGHKVPILVHSTDFGEIIDG
jgi:hypothetical protein